MPFCSKPFGAWNSDNADFNACFEDSVMVAFPSAAMLIYAAIRLIYLRTQETKYEEPANVYIKYNQLVTKLSIVAAIVSFVPTVAVFDTTGSEILAGILVLLASVAAAVVLHYEHSKFLAASLPLVVYWTVSAVIWIIRIHTRFNQNLTQTLVFMIQLLLNLASIGLEFMTYKVAIEKETDASKA